MTVSTIIRTVTFTGNDATTVFPYAFKIPDNDALIVTRLNTDTQVKTVLVKDTDFTVTGIGSDSGGNVTYPVSGAPLSTNEKLTITRTVPLTQLLNITNQSGFDPDVLEGTLDEVVMGIQQVSEQADRALRFPEVDGAAPELPEASARANLYLAFDANGDPTVVALTTITAVVPSTGGTFTGAVTISAGGLSVTGGNVSITEDLTVTGAISTGDFSMTKGSDVASASALTLGVGNIFDVTGTTTITSIATKGVGTMVVLQFDGALTLTHHATNLILPGAANITTYAGYVAALYEYAAGQWQFVADNAVFSFPAVDTQTFTSSGTWTKPTGNYRMVIVDCIGAGGGGGSGRSQSAPASTYFGGGGGGQGGRSIVMLNYAALPSTVSVTVGAGGPGGAGASSNANGNDGSPGGDSFFGAYVAATGGVNGGGGSTTSGTGGRCGGGTLGPGWPHGLETTYDGAIGGNSTSTNTAPSTPIMHPGAGGAGGGIGASSAWGEGDDGGHSGYGTNEVTGGSVTPANEGESGTAGSNGYTLYGGLGGGGAGGNGGNGQNGGNGGNGGAPGGGGGGSGASSGTSGTAGNGARGEVRVYTL